MKENSFGIIPVRFRKGQWDLLLVQHGAGHWAFPKGHAEPGEEPKQTAERELFEETGLKVQSYVLDKTYEENYFFSFQGKKIYKTVTYYLARVSGKVVPQEKEVRDCRWVSLNEATEWMTFPAGKKICQEVIQDLSTA